MLPWLVAGLRLVRVIVSGGEAATSLVPGCSVHGQMRLLRHPTCIRVIMVVVVSVGVRVFTRRSGRVIRARRCLQRRLRGGVTIRGVRAGRGTRGLRALELLSRARRTRVQPATRSAHPRCEHYIVLCGTHRRLLSITLCHTLTHMVAHTHMLNMAAILLWAIGQALMCGHVLMCGSLGHPVRQRHVLGRLVGRTTVLVCGRGVLVCGSCIVCTVWTLAHTLPTLPCTVSATDLHALRGMARTRQPVPWPSVHMRGLGLRSSPRLQLPMCLLHRLPTVRLLL